MSKNIPKTPVIRDWVQTKTKNILRTIVAMIALLGLFGSIVPSYGLFASPPVNAPKLLYTVNDIGDLYWDPLVAFPGVIKTKPGGTVVTGPGGKQLITLRMAIEATNRNCDSGKDNHIRFDYANLTLDGKPITSIVDPKVGDGSKDTPGKYSVGADTVYRISLNTFLPDLVCDGTVIDGEFGNPNTAKIGTGGVVGLSTDAFAIPTIKRPAIELMPKNVTTYVRAAKDKSVAADAPAKKYNSIFNCGIYMRSDNQAVIGISIFGFGGGGINDGNICVGPYSSGTPVWMPDPAVPNNPVFPAATAYFPVNNAIGYCYRGTGLDFLDLYTNAVVGAGDPTADGKCGKFIFNQLDYGSMYEVASTDLNDTVFSGQVRPTNLDGYQAPASTGQNTKNDQVLRNVVGATATLLAPGDSTFVAPYDSAKAKTIATADFHSKNNGIFVLGSDFGYIENNIILFNGGITKAIAGNSSPAGILFDRAGYTGNPNRTEQDMDANTSPGEALNPEGWTVSLNEIALNIDNDRDYGGHGIFINIAQNGTLNAPRPYDIDNNRLYENGGAGLRTFVPNVNAAGNKIYDNGKDETLTPASVVVGSYAAGSGATAGVPAPTYSPQAPSFKHGMYMECGAGYIVHNEIFNHPGSAVATSGGNMYCSNGGEQLAGGLVISENSFYNNKKLGIDLFYEWSIKTQILGGTTSTTTFAKNPSHNVEYEKPIGSEFDRSSKVQFTGIDTNAGDFGKAGPGSVGAPTPGANRQYVTLNTIQSLENIRADATAAADPQGAAILGGTTLPRTFLLTPPKDPGSNLTEKLLAGNLSTPFPIFTYTTQDCSTKKIKLHGYVAKDNVVEVFTPDITKVESYEEGKTYLFDITDNNVYAGETDLIIAKIHEKYTNKSVIYDDAGVPLMNGKVNDLPYYDAATDTLKRYSDVGLQNVDKVIDGEILVDNFAHEFTVETDKLVIGDVINATATDYTTDPGEIGTTSEFSPNFLIQPINPCPTASIVKAWTGTRAGVQVDGAERTGPAVVPPDVIPTYKIGDTLTFDITITNEDANYGLSHFNIKDDAFASNTALDASTLVCTPSAPSGTLGLPTAGVKATAAKPGDAGSTVADLQVDGTNSTPAVVTPVATYGAAALATGVDIHMVTAIAPKATFKLACEIKVKDINGQITNTATLAPATGFPLLIVPPATLKQTDLTTSALVAPVQPLFTDMLANAKSGDPVATAAFTAAMKAYNTAYVPYAAAMLADIAKIATDRIDAKPVIEEASIIKSWNPGTEPLRYRAGDPLNFNITVYNESKTETLSGFTIKDAGFTADGAGTLSCTPTPAGVPAGPFDKAAMTAGVSFKPTTPVAVGGSVVFACTETATKPGIVTATGAFIKNTAILSSFDPAKPITLDILKPATNNPAAAVGQTDKDAVAIKNDPLTIADTITATPIIEEASIVKAWDAGVEPQEYKAGDPLNFTISVFNESKTDTLTGFTIKDSGFNADVTTTMTCTPSVPGTPAGPFDLAAMTSGVAFKPTTPVAIGGKVAFKCVQSASTAIVTVAPAVITNKAILSPFDSAAPKALVILKPKTNNTTALDQTDKVTSATANDVTNAEDSITAIPQAKKLISIQKAWVTDPVSYILGTPLDFTIKITNEGTTPVTTFNLTDDNFGGKATGMTCDNGFGTGAAKDIVLTTALAPKAVLTINCTAVLAPVDSGIITNKATLAPATGDTTTNVVMPQTLVQSDKDPKTALTVLDTPEAKSDSISVPPAPQASIVKAWDAGVNPQVYTAGDVLKFTITVTNESATAGLTTFKLTDDNFAAKEVATDLKCTPTPAPTTAATFDAAGLAAGVVYVTTAAIAPKGTVKFACTVTATTATQEIINTATLAPASTTAKLGIVAPAALTQTDANITDAANTAKDAIKATPKIESASLIKAWVTPLVEPGTYQTGDTLNFTITVANESALFTLTQFKLTDAGFDTDANSDLECTPDTAPTAVIAAAALAAGVIFKPTSAVPVGGKVVFTCKQTIKSAAGAKTTNRAVLASATTPAALLIVKPAAGAQTDATTSATANDVTNTEDSITATPIFPSASIIKAWSGANPSPYADGATLTYTVKVTNESTNKANLLSFKLSDDNFGGKVTPGTCTAAPAVKTPATIPTPLPATDIEMVAALKPTESVTFTCTGKVIAGTTGDLINTAVLAPSAAAPKLTVVAPTAGAQSDENGDKTVVSTDTIKATKAPTPSVSVVKAWTPAAPESYKPGDTFTYDIVVTNESPTGGATLTKFTLNDDGFAGQGTATTCTATPAEPTFASPFTTQAVTLAAPLAPADSVTFACTGKYSATASGKLVNTVTLSETTGSPIKIVVPSAGPQSDEDPSTADPLDPAFAKDSIIVLPAPKISLKKAWNGTAPADYKATTALKFDIIITNEGVVGDADITDFTLTDDGFGGKAVATSCTSTPAGIVFGTPYTGVKITATIKPTESIKFTCDAVAVAGTTTLVNKATIAETTGFPISIVEPAAKQTDADVSSQNAADPKFENDTITVPPAGAPLVSIKKAWVAPAPVTYDVPDILKYTLTIKNESPAGGADLTKFTLSDDGFKGLATATKCDATPAQPTFAAPFTNQAVVLAAPLAPGSSVIFTCEAPAPAVIPSAPATLVNTVTLSATTGSPIKIVKPAAGQTDADPSTQDAADPTFANDSILVPPLPGTPEASIQKKFLASPALTEYAAGTDISFVITVTNEGTIPVPNFTITDDVFGGAVGVTVSACDKGLVTPFKTATITTPIAVGGNYVITCTAKVDSPLTATGTLKNTATLSKATDPLTVVTPVKGPAQSDGAQTAPADIPVDSISIVPAGTPKASIVKAWDAAKTVTTYKAGDILDFTITIKNEGTVAITEFTLDDDSFNTKATITGCTGDFTYVTPFTSKLVTLATPLAAGASVKVTCKVVAPAASAGVLVNTATLTGTPTKPLTVVEPTGSTQSDGDVSTPGEIANDNITISPTPVPPIYTIKKIIDTTPNTYKAGDTLKYTIRITNHTPAIAIKQVKLIDDCGAAQLENCVLTATPATYDAATNILTGMTWVASADTKSSSFEVKYEGKVKATATGNIANTAKLDPTLPVATTPGALLPVCATDPTMQDFTNADGSIKPCEDDVLTPPTPVLSIRKVLTSATSVFKPGDKFTYDIIVTKLAGTVTQIKVTDDCAGGLLEGTPVAPATTAKCEVTSTDGTYDAATGMLTPLTWSAANTVTLKVVGTVKAGTTTNVMNTATLDFTVPADPKNPTVLPVCSIDPKMTNADGTVPSAADCQKDEVIIKPLPPVVGGDKASIVKAWVDFPGTFTVGDTLEWTVTVTNEGTTDLAKFKILDDNFAASDVLDPATFLCKTTTPAPAFTSAQMLAGFEFVPTTPLKPLETVVFTCSVDVIADGTEGEYLENTATLSAATGQTLEVVVPTKLQQSDLEVGDPTLNASDHIFIDPAFFFPEDPEASIVKRWTTINGAPITASSTYNVGDMLEFEIIVTNEGTEDVTFFSIKDDMFANAKNISMTCDNDYTDFAGQEFDFSDNPLASLESFTITCKVKILTAGTEELRNEVTLIFDQGWIVEPSGEIKQSDGQVGNEADDAKDVIKIKPAMPKIIPVMVTPRTGGQIAIGASIIALLAIGFLTLRKRFVVKK